MDKKQQIWYRWKNELPKLKEEAVDILSRTYLEIGQKPSVEDIVTMANILVDDLANNTQFSTMTMEDVSRGFREGVRAGDESSVFVNVRTWNIWLRKEKKKVAKKVIELHKQQELEYIENARLMGGTIKMKKGQLKLETVRILEALCKHIVESKNDYETEDLKALLSEALAYYDLYLLKKNNKGIEAANLESKLVPKWEEGLRAEIRAYFDEV